MSGVCLECTEICYSAASRKRDIDMNAKQKPKQQPAVGGIYRDKSGSSLVVLSIVRGKAILEYANGSVTSVNTRNWQRICLLSAVY